MALFLRFSEIVLSQPNKYAQHSPHPAAANPIWPMLSARIPPNHGKIAAVKRPTIQTAIETSINTAKLMTNIFLMACEWPSEKG